MIRIDLVSIFPQMLNGPLDESMVKRAVDRGLAVINTVDLRDFTEDRHRQVDDTPYGGGGGMIFKPEPLFKAVDHLKECSGCSRSRVILLTPQGRLFNQDYARELAREEHLILLCGHYEGVDERVSIALADDEISIGDYILTGGELAALVVTDAVVRLQEGLLDKARTREESFTEYLLEYPQYTRPPEYRGLKVPAVLLSGNHADIKRWRREQALLRTRQRRPDLLAKAVLTPEDRRILAELQNTREQDNSV